ncbi:hypothetical protein BMS3Bbin11_01213 [bacterium BMS3Bbin11]|nr:hypothetical protein BMS3Bbin11_01213 [bacterium BMS3Bbin11]
MGEIKGGNFVYRTVIAAGDDQIGVGKFEQAAVLNTGLPEKIFVKIAVKDAQVIT